MRAGDLWENLWWIERGVLRLFYLDRDGHSANKNFYLDGALFWPVTPALASEPIGFWVEAVEDSLVWALPWTRWQGVVQDFARWQTFERGVLANLLQEKMQREQHFLQRTATQRYQDLKLQHPDWAERIPLRQLASYLGVTDVALSRIRRRLNQG